jgi:hypothetical protein
MRSKNFGTNVDKVGVRRVSINLVAKIRSFAEVEIPGTGYFQTGR